MALNHQQFGRAAQARFLLDAHEKGMDVCIPFDSLPGFDYVVDTGKKLLRVQVKGVRVSRRRDYYTVNFRRRRTDSIPKFDICAVWMADVQRWTFLPPSLARKRIVRLTADGKHSRAGWELFYR